MKPYIFIIAALIGIMSFFSCTSNTGKTAKTEKDITSVSIDPVADSLETNKGLSPKNNDTIKEAPAIKKALARIAYGIDISKYQGDEMNFLDKNKDSLAFIICKATEGVSYTDPKFNHNWNTAAQKGFIRGAYHFYRSNDHPEPQAKHFINAISDLNDTDLPPIVDFEEGSIDQSQSIEQIQASLLTFLNRIEEKMNRKPMIYTDINTGNKYLDKPAYANYPLWIANYTKRDQPNLPNAWKDNKWIIWQKSDHYKIENTANDFDIFNGNVIDLKEFISKN